MGRLPWVPIVIVLLLALGGALAYWALAPRLLAVSPPDGAVAVPARSSLRLEFSRPLRTEELLRRLDIQPPVQGAASWQGSTLVFSPDEPWPSGGTIRVSLDPGARADGWPGLALRVKTSWSFSVTQPRLAYLYPADGPADIYVLDPYSGESQRWTLSPGGVVSYSVAPGASAIYYSARAEGGGSAIYRLDMGQEWRPPDEGADPDAAELAEPDLVLECPEASCRDPVVSPQGDILAYVRVAFIGGADPSYPQVWLLPLAVEGIPPAAAEPTLAGSPAHQTLDPAWSVDGVLAFYDTDTAEFVMLDPGQGVLARFANQTGEPGAWHPNGRDFVAPEINFLDQGGSEELGELQPLANSHLMLFNLDGGEAQDLTSEEDLEDTAPAFSPDGAYLALARKSLHIDRWTPGRQLWLMRVGTWQAEALTDDELYSHYDFAWSPAGDLLAIVRFNQSVLSEPPELWLIDPFSGRATQLVIGGYRPQWIR
jgi:hypothetical protein